MERLFFICLCFFSLTTACAQSQKFSGIIESHIYPHSETFSINIKGDVAKALYERMETPAKPSPVNATILTKMSEDEGLSCSHFTKTNVHLCNFSVYQKSGNFLDLDAVPTE